MSIHSNRLAPSQDIAFAFAYANCVHHLLSGARFRQRANAPTKARVGVDADKVFAGEAGVWHAVRQEPLRLAARQDAISSYLGLLSVVSKNGKTFFIIYGRHHEQ
jgi:hypothetical protein